MEQPNYSSLIEKWSPVLDEESAGEIKDNHRRSVTAHFGKPRKSNRRTKRTRYVI